MSHLALQEVMDRINKANSPAKDLGRNDNRIKYQPHRPEFLPGITRCGADTELRRNERDPISGNPPGSAACMD
jgi:hypothetical protein